MKKVSILIAGFMAGIFFLLAIPKVLAHDDDIWVMFLQKILENQKKILENQKRIGYQPFSMSQVSVLDLTQTPIRNHGNQIDDTLKGFAGGFTDGRYGYFVPYDNGSRFGKVVRVDLQDFKTVDVLDLSDTPIENGNKDLDLKGFVGGFAVGRYGYFVPNDNGHPFGKVVRVDLQDFKTIKVLDLANTPIRNPQSQRDESLKGFYGGFTDGQYGYFVPYYNGDSRFGKVVRVDLQDFKTVDVLDLSNTRIRNPQMERDENLKGFIFGFTDGRYGYFVPHYNERLAYFGKVAKVDLKDFQTVDVLNLTNKDDKLKGFSGGFTDGHYGYFVPHHNGQPFGKVAKVDLQDFKTIDMLDLADAPIKNRDYQKDASLKCFIGGFTDGRYGYFVPNHNGSNYFGKVIRVDLCDFSTIDVLDLSLKDSTLKGFHGGFTDGKYGYFVPCTSGAWGKVVRISLLAHDPSDIFKESIEKSIKELKELINTRH